MATAWVDITDSAFYGDYNGYIRFANQLFKQEGALTSTSGNAMRIFTILENTHYRVTVQMRNRFRLGCLATLTNGQTVTNYIFDPLDANDATDQGGAVRTLEISSGAGQTYLVVGAWTVGASDTAENTVNTISVEEQRVTHTVQFVDWNDTVLKSEEVPSGGSAAAPENPSRTGCRFTGWDVPFTNITADTVVTAQYESLSSAHTVTFLDYDGSMLKTEQVEDGADAFPPLPPLREGYIFDHWDSVFTVVESNLTVTAVYREALDHTIVKIYDSLYTLVRTVEKVLSANYSESLDGELTFDFSTLADRASGIEVGHVAEYNGCYFNVVRVAKSISSGIMVVAVTCEHISYMLNEDRYKIDLFDFTGAPATGLAQLLAGTPFSPGTVDFTDTVTMQINTSVTRREALMQFIAILGGEIEYLGHCIGIRRHRGSTEVKQLMELKNVTDVSVTHDSRSATTSYSVSFHRIADYAVGDEVHILFAPLDVDTSTRIIGMEYDPFYRYSIRVEVGSYVPTINDNLFRITQTAAAQNEDMSQMWGAFNSFESDYSDLLSTIKEVQDLIVGQTQFTVSFTDGSSSAYDYTVDSEGRITGITKVG